MQREACWWSAAFFFVGLVLHLAIPKRDNQRQSRTTTTIEILFFDDIFFCFEFETPGGGIDVTFAHHPLVFLNKHAIERLYYNLERRTYGEVWNRDSAQFAMGKG